MAVLIIGMCLVIVVGYIAYPFWVKIPQATPQSSQDVLGQIEEDVQQERIALRMASGQRVSEQVSGEEHV